MDLQRITDTLTIDEDVRLVVYLDSDDNPTVGRGHLVQLKDKLHVGDKITPEQMEIFYKADIQEAITSARSLVPNFDKHPSEVQDVIVMMAFNMGYKRLSGFREFLKALRVEDYAWAAREMLDSLWHRQLGARPERLAATVRKYASTKP
jgi:lysozyme